MSQSIELPLDTRCYLCDSYYANVHHPFVIYKCFKCKKFTPYCINCEIKLQKLFGKGNFFKCTHCDKLANAEDKIEVGPSKNNLYENSFYKTPSKPFMENNIPISSIRPSNNSNNFFFKVNNGEEERKNNDNERNDNSPSDKIMLSHFLDDFNKMNINFSLKNNDNNNDISNAPFNNKNYLNNITTVNYNNNNRNINISDISREANNKSLINSTSLSNYQKNNINDFSLLTSRNRLNKRFCLNESLLGKKREDSQNANEFRGFRQNSKINIRNPSKGKFKNLISMKMSKVYNNDEMANTIDEYNKKNNGNNFGFNLLREKSRNKDNTRHNLFSNSQRNINLSFINGKSTPHRLSNNSFEYF